MISEHFLRYKPLLLADWEAFVAAVQRPLPTTIWANPLKITPDELAARMHNRGIPLVPLPWYVGGFQLPADVSPGLRWEYLAGLYHVQEEVSLLPVTLLDLQPTDRVLDMCAAPGNKTAQMGVMMGNQGTIVANDRSAGRMRAARQVLNRLGLINVTAVTRDAANLPRSIGLFDKVLADVPCTCEGTCRKAPDVMQRVTVKENQKLARVQRAILRKAVQVCRSGGRIVYSTCTFAPEENELVVDAILREFDGRVRLIPAHIPGFKTQPGITQWQGEVLSDTLHHCLRVWPHLNDSGGFFLAVLEKVDTVEPQLSNMPPVSRLFSERLEPEPWIDKLVDRFGFPADLFDKQPILRWGNRGVWLTNEDQTPPENPHPDSVGIMFMRTQGKYPKLTTGSAMLFGSQAVQNVLDLDAEQARAFFTRQEFSVASTQLEKCSQGSGYVLLRYDGYVVGVGVYRAKKGAIESLFPKGWVREGVQV